MRFLATLVVGVVTWLTFWPAASFDFVRWDDDINITQNPLLSAPWSWSLVGQMFSSDQALRFKPLHWLLFRALRTVAGFDPVAWHGLNLALHTFAAVLVVVVLRQVFRLIAPEQSPERIELAAGLGAALWALHPLRAEVVGWATASTYSLTTLWLLASFSCYLRAATSRERGSGWLVVSWLFAVAAYASYPVGVTYGLWLIAVDRWLLPRPRPTAPVRARTPIPWVKYAAFLAPAILAVALTSWSRFAAPGIFTTAPDLRSVGLGLRGLAAIASLGYLAVELVWPVNLTPNMPPMILNQPAILALCLVSVLVAAVMYWAWHYRRSKPGFALIAIGAAGLALPCLGLTERPTWPVDRYSYLVDVVLIGGIAGAALKAESFARRRFVAAVAALGLVACVPLTRAQLRIWQNSETLFSHMEQHPRFTENPRQQGHVYILWGNHEASEGHTARATELFNRAQQVYLAAIRAAIARGDYPDALSLVTHLERYFPLTPVMLREKGTWLLRTGREAEAIEQLKRAQQALPDDPRTQSLLKQAEDAARESQKDRGKGRQ